MQPENKVIDYVTPTAQELAARKKRNLAIAAALVTFCALIFALMVFKSWGGGA
ncbi:hypothetical protein [Robiginitomaculum antarcticum]|uniref:hypothetical protein n=1 Tax=Robiginitomaculum antarcticum TaxID=437507 RepID=UPI00035E40B1|nr:hypothetical protein [Robiginitomaculum antarcticum]